MGLNFLKLNAIVRLVVATVGQIASLEPLLLCDSVSVHSLKESFQRAETKSVADFYSTGCFAFHEVTVHVHIQDLLNR